jgi:hypothetical protein
MSDRDLKDGLKAAGYSLEEVWFYRHNQELIEEMREKEESKKRDRSHLRLLQGGLSESATSDPGQEPPVPVKKAA